MEENKTEMNKIVRTISKSKSITSMNGTPILCVGSHHTIASPLSFYAANIDVSDRRRCVRLLDLLQQWHLLQSCESDVLQMGEEFGKGRHSILKIGARQDIDFAILDGDDTGDPVLVLHH